MVDEKPASASQNTGDTTVRASARDAQADGFLPDCTDGRCMACRPCYQKYVAYHMDCESEAGILRRLAKATPPHAAAPETHATEQCIDEVLERRLEARFDAVQTLLYRQQYRSVAAVDLDVPGDPLLCWAAVGDGDNAEWGLFVLEFDPTVHKCKLEWWQVNLDRAEDLEQYGKLTALEDCTLKVRQAAAWALATLWRHIRTSEPPEVRDLRLAVEAVNAMLTKIADLSSQES